MNHDLLPASAVRNAPFTDIDNAALPEEWFEKSAPATLGFSEKELVSMFLTQQESSVWFLRAYLYPVAEPGWIIDKNEHGEPSRKRHNQELGFFCRSRDDYFYIRGVLRQVHEGSGKYGPTFFHGLEKIQLNGRAVERALASESASRPQQKRVPPPYYGMGIQ